MLLESSDVTISIICDDEKIELPVRECLESVLEPDGFIDANLLPSIWPTEFDCHRILIVRVDGGRIQSFTLYTPDSAEFVSEDGEWCGNDIILTLQWDHFTLLMPKNKKDPHPISTLLAYAGDVEITPVEFVVPVSTLKRRISVASLCVVNSSSSSSDTPSQEAARRPSEDHNVHAAKERPPHLGVEEQL